jgi:dihydrofolate synthase/folylpolyglutamate synthase
MTYEEARSFIEEANQYGSKLGLETVTELMSRLGNPQEELKVIHIAGTNGKGSTNTFIASILAAAGYRVGRYISPAVFSYRERIQIFRPYTEEEAAQAKSGIAIGADKTGCPYRIEDISRQGISDAIEKVKLACEAMVSEGLVHPTSFEIETAMAILYFREVGVDFAVIEVGLGGRMDATNIIRKPICVVITSISMDHMQFLGDTLALIAEEKAGIIKEDCPVVTCSQKPEALEVLLRVSREKRAPFTLADHTNAIPLSFIPEGTEFRYQGEEYRIQLLGAHQIMNAVLAIEAVKALRSEDLTIPEEAVKTGLSFAKWSGRLEMIGQKPYFIIDGAHNEEAAMRLADAIRLYFKERRIIYIMGIFADKDYRRVVELTAPLADQIITLTPNNSRALSSDALAKEVQKYCPTVLDAKTVRQAVTCAYEAAGEEDIILAFGSLSFLGELKEIISLYQEHPDPAD